MNIQRVFISSVMQGYADRRQAAAQALRALGMQPYLAEEAPASAGTPRELVLADSLGSSDAVVALYGNRYGWTGSQSGLAPTEEEYREARRVWKPVYAFIDRMQSGQPEPREKQFLDQVQNWDAGVMRNEFHSLAELQVKIKVALTGTDHSPRYRAFLTQLRLQAVHQGYREIAETRLPAFDALVNKNDVQFVHNANCLAVMDGDLYTAPQVQRIAALWKTTLQNYFRPSNWNQTGIEAAMVVAVERNPSGLNATILPRDRDASFGGFYGLLVNLASAQVTTPQLRASDQVVPNLWLKPIVQPALSAR